MPVNTQTRTKLDKKSLVSGVNGTSSLTNLRSLVEALELESLTLTGDLVVSGSLVANTADINGGTFDGVVGGTTPAAGSFTTVAASSTVTATAGVRTGNTTNAVVKTDLVTLTAAEIVGTSAGDIGHSAGAVLVAAAPGVTHEFISAVLIYDYSTAAYTGGNNDLTIRQGTTAVSAAIADADLVGDSADDIAYVNALAAADIKLTANSTINLAGTAYTQPGTAAGVLRVYVTYRSITTGL